MARGTRPQPWSGHRHRLGGGTLIVFAALALAVVALVQQVPELTCDGHDRCHLRRRVGRRLAWAYSATPSPVVPRRPRKTILELADQLAALVTVTVLGILLAFYFLRDGGRLWKGVAPHVRSEAEPAGPRRRCAGLRRPGRLHDRDRCHLVRRSSQPVGHHGPARAAPGVPGLRRSRSSWATSPTSAASSRQASPSSSPSPWATPSTC